MDIVDRESRSRMMSGIRGVNTLPEMKVRSVLHALGYRFRLHDRSLPGSPDIVMRSRNVVVFVHGCFWHRHEECSRATTPSTRQEFWSRKLQANVVRDRMNVERLREMGWRVLIVWECAIPRGSEAFDNLRAKLTRWMNSSRGRGEIPRRPVSPAGIRSKLRGTDASTTQKRHMSA